MDNTAETPQPIDKPEASRENPPKATDKPEQEKPILGQDESQIVERIKEDGDQDQVLRDIAQPSQDRQPPSSQNTETKPEEKVYEEPYEDPEIRQIEQAIASQTNQDTQVMGAMQSQDPEYTELWYRTYARESMHAWGRFVANNPKRAEAYAAEYPAINTALEARKRKLEREAQSQPQQRANSDEQQVTAEQITEKTGHEHEQQVDTGGQVDEGASEEDEAKEAQELGESLKAIEELLPQYEESGFLRQNAEYEGGLHTVEVKLLKQKGLNQGPYSRGELPPFNTEFTTRDLSDGKIVKRDLHPDDILAHFRIKHKPDDKGELYTLYEFQDEGVRKLDLAEVAFDEDWSGYLLTKPTDESWLPTHLLRSHRIIISNTIRQALKDGPRLEKDGGSRPKDDKQSPPDKPAEAAGIALKNQGGSEEVHETVYYPSAEPLKH